MMKKLILLCLIISGITNINAQQSFTAIIADPQIGDGSNAENLIKIVDDINKRANFSIVAVIGNLTTNGRFEQFLQCQEILDGLIAPYFVVGGRNDYLQSEGLGIEIKMVWGDENFLIEDKNGIHLGINSFQSRFDDKNYISIETINWLAEKLQNKKSKEIFLFSYNAFPQEISNWNKAVDVFKGFKVYPITLKDKYLNKNNIAFQCNSLTSENFQTYSLFYNSKEIINFFEANVSDSSIKSVEQISKKEFPNIFLQNEINQNFSHPKINYSTIDIEKTIYSSPVLSEDKLIATAKNGTVFCLSKDGKEKWKFETNGTIYSSPVIEGDLVVAATNEGDLFTINSNNGNLFQVIGIGETITSDISLIAFDNTQSNGIVFGTASGNLYCYDLYTLEFLWQNNSANDWIISSVSSNDGKIFLQDRKGNLLCVSSQSGILLWKWKPLHSNANPYFKSDLLLNRNEIYLIDSDGNLICIDTLLGTEKWKIKNINASGLIRINKGELILSTNKNKMLNVSPKLGKMNSVIDLPPQTKDETITDIVIIEDKMFAGFTNGEVYQIEQNQFPELVFNSYDTPIVSLINLNGNCLVTDFDGRMSVVEVVKY